MLNVMKSFVRDENGLEMVEWAIVAALITAGAAAALGNIGGDVATKLQALETVLTGAP